MGIHQPLLHALAIGKGGVTGGHARRIVTSFLVQFRMDSCPLFSRFFVINIMQAAIKRTAGHKWVRPLPPHKKMVRPPSGIFNSGPVFVDLYDVKSGHGPVEWRAGGHACIFCQADGVYWAGRLHYQSSPVGERPALTDMVHVFHDSCDGTRPARRLVGSRGGQIGLC